MNNLNLIELRKSELKQITGGTVVIGLFFRAFDFMEALFEGIEEAWIEKCKCTCKK